jgi:hypothetical protein
LGATAFSVGGRSSSLTRDFLNRPIFDNAHTWVLLLLFSFRRKNCDGIFPSFQFTCWCQQLRLTETVGSWQESIWFIRLQNCLTPSTNKYRVVLITPARIRGNSRGVVLVIPAGSRLGFSLFLIHCGFQPVFGKKNSKRVVSTLLRSSTSVEY